MRQTIKPRLRYFARFREPYGYLRAVVRNGKTRKYIRTTIVVSKEQLSRLDTSGGMIVNSESDLMVNTRLLEYTKYIWETVNPLIASGEFDNMSGRQITNAIFRHKEEKEKERTARGLTRLGYDVSQLKPGWEKEGCHYADGSMMSERDERETIALLNEFLNGSNKGKGGYDGEK